MLSRRRFLTVLGLGTAAAAVPPVVEVVTRRIWQVPAGAPVGLRSGTSVAMWDAAARDYAQAYRRMTEAGLEPGAVSRYLAQPNLISGHGYTYDPPEPITLAPMPSEYAEEVERYRREVLEPLSHLNSVARGDVEPGVYGHPYIKSGTGWLMPGGHMLVSSAEAHSRGLPILHKNLRITGMRMPLDSDPLGEGNAIRGEPA